VRIFLRKKGNGMPNLKFVSIRRHMNQNKTKPYSSIGGSIANREGFKQKQGGDFPANIAGHRG
jgi:hypothetical protein